jgi:hypothetical protein
LKFSSGSVQSESASSTGAGASMTLRAYIMAGIGSLASLTIRTSIDVGKGTAKAVASSVIAYDSSTAKIGVLWVNQGPLELGGGGGTLVVEGCAAVLKCGTLDLLKWPSLSSTKTWYRDVGNETGIAAF